MSKPSPDIQSSHLQQLAEYDTALLANLLAFVDSTPDQKEKLEKFIRTELKKAGETPT